MSTGRTRGAVMLAQLGLRQEDIARKCGVNRSAPGHWMTGRWLPRDRRRVTLRDVYGIPLDAWVEAPAAARVDC